MYNTFAASVHFYKTFVLLNVHSLSSLSSSSSSIPSQAATELLVVHNDLTKTIFTSSEPITINIYALLRLDANKKLNYHRLLYLRTPKNASSTFALFVQLRTHAVGISSCNRSVFPSWHYNTTGSYTLCTCNPQRLVSTNASELHSNRSDHQ